MMKKLFILVLAIHSVSLFGSDEIQFDRWFDGRTLRLDYIFAGDSGKQEISIDEMQSLPYWAGRRHHLDSLFVTGNGQVYVRDAASEKLIYATSFSTLFQEWQHTTEASAKVRSFENTFQVPMPRQKVNVTVELMDSWQKVVASHTMTVNPKDILIRDLSHVAPLKHKDILENGPAEECVDIAFVAEGYQENQMDIFYDDVNKVCEQIFSHEPYKRLKNRFNIVAVASASADEGTSIPSKNIWKQTALGSSFDTFYSERYLTTLHVKHLNDLLTGIPFEQIIVLVNTDKYGGGGIYNLYMLASAHHAKSLPVCVHEFGHSFAGLGDEYAYAGDGDSEYYHKDVEPWEKNITTLKDFKSKWADMIAPGTPVPTPLSSDPQVQNTRVGLFEGAGYMMKGVYRPVQECRMKINEVPTFCPVCQRSIEQVINYLTK